MAFFKRVLYLDFELGNILSRKAWSVVERWLCVATGNRKSLSRQFCLEPGESLETGFFYENSPSVSRFEIESFQIKKGFFENVSNWLNKTQKVLPYVRQ